MTTTARMTTELRAHCVPVLRRMGFKGFFPHFYRETEGFVALVNFQFNAMGEKFAVNLGYADPERRNVVAHRRQVETKDLRVSATGSLPEENGVLTAQWRLGAKPIGGGLFEDSWFSFAPGQYGGDRGAEPVDHVRLAEDCAALLETEGEAWFAEKRAFVAGLSGAGRD